MVGAQVSTFLCLIRFSYHELAARRARPAWQDRPAVILDATSAPPLSSAGRGHRWCAIARVAKDANFRRYKQIAC